MSNNNNNVGYSTTKSKIIIPNSIVKTIQNIKEITKNHSDDDIYAMLKECSMDPNETIQRLLHLDTFHQVKSKRDKRKEVEKSRPGGASRWTPSHQLRGFMGGRVNTNTHYSSNVARGQRSNSVRKENGVEEIKEKRFTNLSFPVLKEVNVVQPYHAMENLPISINGAVKLCNDEPPHAHNPWIRTTVGPIIREARVEDIPSEASVNIPGPVKTEPTSSSHLNQSDPYNVNGSLMSSLMVEKEASKPAMVTDPNGLRELVADETSHLHTPKPSSPRGVGPFEGAKEATSTFVKPKNLHGQNVIIPDHMQVPDAVKDVLKFGSIDAGFIVGQNIVKIKSTKKILSVGDAPPDDVSENSSSCDIDAVSTTVQTENTDNQQTQFHSLEENLHVAAKICFSATNAEQVKENNTPSEGLPFPTVHATSSYNFQFLPPLMASTLGLAVGFENQAHLSSSLSGDSPAVSNRPSTSPLTQSWGVSPLSNPIFPPNFTPYTHYFSPVYVPPMNQYYGHTILPSIPTTNIFLPGSTEVKKCPPHTKSGPHYGNKVPNETLTSGNSSSSEDRMPTLLKDKNGYPRQQSVGTGVWIPTAGRDTSNSSTLKCFLNNTNGGFTVYRDFQPSQPNQVRGTTFQHPSPVSSSGSVQ